MAKNTAHSKAQNLVGKVTKPGKENQYLSTWEKGGSCLGKKSGSKSGKAAYGGMKGKGKRGKKSY